MQSITILSISLGIKIGSPKKEAVVFIVVSMEMKSTRSIVPLFSLSQIENTVVRICSILPEVMIAMP
jgi:hypothetical protein